MRLSGRMMWPLVLSSLAATGCNQNRFLAAQPPLRVPPQHQPAPQVSQSEDFGRRATALDADNKDLHSQLALAHQRSQLLEEHVVRLNKELREKGTELQQLLTEKKQSQQQLAAVEASTRRGGGATITANNSLKEALPAISLPGIEVRQDGEVIRIELPTDQLFQPGSDTLLPASQTVLAQVSAAIQRNYAQQMVSIEGHTDSVPLGTTSNYQLSSRQAAAIFRTLTTNHQLSPRQLFWVAHGPNHPRASNATAAGRAKNRRIELVVYPDQSR